MDEPLPAFKLKTSQLAKFKTILKKFSVLLINVKLRLSLAQNLTPKIFKKVRFFKFSNHFSYLSLLNKRLAVPFNSTREFQSFSRFLQHKHGLNHSSLTTSFIFTTATTITITLIQLKSKVNNHKIILKVCKNLILINAVLAQWNWEQTKNLMREKIFLKDFLTVLMMRLV